MTGMDWLTVAALAFVAYSFLGLTADIPLLAAVAIWTLWGAVTVGVAWNLWDRFRKKKAAGDTAATADGQYNEGSQPPTEESNDAQ